MSNSGYHTTFHSSLMYQAPERGDLDPPPAPGLWRGVVLALLAHGLLLVALTWGVSWKRQSENLSAEAELWSAVPQQAAPKAVEAPPPPPPKPIPQVRAPEPAPEPPRPTVDISIEKEKKRLAQEKVEREREEEKRAQAKKLATEKKAAEEKKIADDKRKRELEAQRREEADQQALAKQRDENMKRITGMAGASGGPTATGTAQQSSGPSQGYAGRIRARIKPNIVFTEDIAGNPTAEVEVRAAPDGTIVSRKLLKSSGNAAWDESVLKAIDKTEVLPRDVDGRVPSPIVIAFRPKD
jgi:colicin import membrane protein